MEPTKRGRPVGDDDAVGGAGAGEGEGDLVFEDPYEGIYDDDGGESSDDGGDDEEDDDGDVALTGTTASGSTSAAVGGSGASAGAVGGAGASASSRKMDEDDDEDEDDGPKQVWRPDIDALAEGEQLECDLDAYVMYHAMQVEWPCLSFDVVPDRLGVRTKFPLSCTIVAGTQADRADHNRLMVMRFSSLHRTQDDDKSSDGGIDEEDDEDADADANVDVQRIHHHGSVNRVRVMPQEPHIVAAWSDTGVVRLFDIRPQVRLLDAAEGKGAAPPVTKGYGPVYEFKGHSDEGYAVDWSPECPGRLATGDCKRNILVWDVDHSAAAGAMSSAPPSSGAVGDFSSVWHVDTTNPYTSHSGSVEDIQWSPNEETVFASCGTDGTVRIWDTRAPGKSMLHVKASETDVNVLSWSRLMSFLLASGADDGAFKVWDLRTFTSGKPFAHFAWHRKPITAIEWAPDDENVLLVASEDNQVTLWDLSLEDDEEAEMALAMGKGPGMVGGGASSALASSSSSAAGFLASRKDPRLADIPPQLLFIHGGQSEVKEAHFHRQMPGVVLSTAADGFNVFKPDVVVTT